MEQSYNHMYKGKIKRTTGIFNSLPTFLPSRICTCPPPSLPPSLPSILCIVNLSSLISSSHLSTLVSVCVCVFTVYFLHTHTHSHTIHVYDVYISSILSPPFTFDIAKNIYHYRHTSTHVHVHTYDLVLLLTHICLLFTGFCLLFVFMRLLCGSLFLYRGRLSRKLNRGRKIRRRRKRLLERGPKEGLQLLHGHQGRKEKRNEM